MPRGELEPKDNIMCKNSDMTSHERVHAMLMLQFLPQQLFPFRWTQTPPLVPALPGATQEGLLSRPLAHLQWILPTPVLGVPPTKEFATRHLSSHLLLFLTFLLFLKPLHLTVDCRSRATARPRLPICSFPLSLGSSYSSRRHGSPGS